MSEISVLGTGLMGAPMVRNIARAGHRVTVWNRTAAKAQALSTDTIRARDTPADAVDGANIIISMLTDGPAVLDVARGVTLTKGALWIDMSSTRPQDAHTMAALMDAQGAGFLDAPVSGGVTGAEQATLAIMVGGSEPMFARAGSVLDSMGRATLVGPTGAGQLAKLANQAIVGVTIAAVAEAMLLLEQGGADTAAVRAALKGGFADSTILQQHGARMQARDFAPGGPSSIQLKDLNNVLAEAGDLDLPTVTQVRDRYARYVADLAGGDQDHAGLFAELLDRNDLS